METLLNFTRQHRTLSIVYLANLFMSFHFFFLVYINSSFLETLVSTSTIGILYTISAVVNILILSNIARIVNAIGKYRLLVGYVLINGLAVFGLFLSGNASAIIPFFALHQIFVVLISYSLDLFLEEATLEENTTGSIRSGYLTLGNIALVISPILVGWLASGDNYQRVYLVSLLFLLPLIYIVWTKLNRTIDQPAKRLRISDTIRAFISNRDLGLVWLGHSLLQFFYAWMIVYSPLYLHKYIGFSWGEIGIMFSIMLLPFVIFEIPVGRLADKRFGEKELMAIGFGIMALAVILMPTIKVASFIIWTAILFTSRIGASFVEITTESYFFKHVKDSDTDEIGFFRLTRPLSYITAPSIATIALYFVGSENGFGNIFYLLGLIVIAGVFISLQLKDTR